MLFVDSQYRTQPIISFQQVKLKLLGICDSTPSPTILQIEGNHVQSPVIGSALIYQRNSDIKYNKERYYHSPRELSVTIRKLYLYVNRATKKLARQEERGDVQINGPAMMDADCITPSHAFHAESLGLLLSELEFQKTGVIVSMIWSMI